jgi:prepilin peptidase CpaA
MSPAVAIAVVLVCFVAAWTDARSGKIPNLLTLPAAAVAVLVHGAVGGLAGFGMSLLGAVISGAVPYALHRSTRGRAIGGGDVKLFAALGAIGGPMLGLEIELSSFLLLGVFAMARLAFRGQLLGVFINALRLLVNPLLPTRLRRSVPQEALTEMRLGPAIAVAAGVVLLRDHLVAWLPWLG